MGETTGTSLDTVHTIPSWSTPATAPSMPSVTVTVTRLAPGQVTTWPTTIRVTPPTTPGATSLRLRTRLLVTNSSNSNHIRHIHPSSSSNTNNHSHHSGLLNQLFLMLPRWVIPKLSVIINTNNTNPQCNSPHNIQCNSPHSIKCSIVLLSSSIQSINRHSIICSSPLSM